MFFNFGDMRSLVHAPLPRWRDVILAIFRAESEEELAVPWVRASELAYWFSRSAWSLVAIAEWRLRFTKNKNIYVWVPDYFCNASLTPLRNIDEVKLIFYPITEQLTPNLEACQAMITQQPIDLFVLVHYFGQVAPAGCFANFCKQHRAWLIEDAAHTLQPVPGIGESGDCVLYSPHKHLATPDGAVMVIRQNGPAQLAKSEGAIRKFNEARTNLINGSRNSNRFPIFWLVKRLAQKLGFRSKTVRLSFLAEFGSHGVSAGQPQLSGLAKGLLRIQIERLRLLPAKRSRNAQLWKKLLQLMGDENLIWLFDSDQPYLYLAGFSERLPTRTGNLFYAMQDFGMPVTTWPDLPPEVSGDKEGHYVANLLRETRVFLPVHQDISDKNILKFLKVVAKSKTKKWHVSVLSHEAWNKYWRECPHPNLTQSWEFGQAKQHSNNWRPIRLLISDDLGRPLALTQALIKGFKPIGYLARINRGPLLLNGGDKELDEICSLLVIDALLNYASSKRWRFLQIAPELEDAVFTRQAVRSLGFRRVKKPAWASGLLRLQVDERDLLMRLNGKWRNSMRKAEKLGVVVSQQNPNEYVLNYIVERYKEFQKKQRFAGVPEALLLSLSRQARSEFQFNIYFGHEASADQEQDPIGILVTIGVGNTVTYLLGISENKGRALNANSILLWNALKDSNSRYQWFDVGGLNDETPGGIVKFKMGLNPNLYKLVGEWFRLI